MKKFLLIISCTLLVSFTCGNLYAADDVTDEWVEINGKKVNIKDLKMSYSTFCLASDLIDDMRVDYKEEGSKLFLGGKAKGIYEKAMKVALKLHEITGRDEYIQQAFVFAEKTKAGVLLAALTEANAKQFSGIPDSTIEIEKDLRIDLAFYEKSLQEETYKGKDADSAKINIWQNKLFDLKQRYDVLTRKLEEDFPEYYKMKYDVSTGDAKKVQAFLDEKTGLIEYFVGDSTIYIFTLTKTDFQIKELKREEVYDSQIEKMRDAITNKNYNRYADLAYILYEELVKDVIANFKDASGKYTVSNLNIIPDGMLNYIPFEALLTEKAPQNSTDYSKLNYLIKDFSVNYAYSATLLMEQSARKTSVPENDFLAFAPVHFEGKYEIGGADAKISSLPATESEVDKILEVFGKKKKNKIYKLKDATEEAVKKDELETYKYIHFATHGIVNEVKPKLSGILFHTDKVVEKEKTDSLPDFIDFHDAGSTPSNDGVLYSGEIYNLNMKADLVVLSACETGLGKVERGEGIIGLTRGFLFSGAQNLVVSLWRVADESTSELMINFYKHINKDKAYNRSLQEAKLKMIKEGKYASPYFWAPFILIGKS